jgi:hypothetical protein
MCVTFWNIYLNDRKWFEMCLVFISCFVLALTLALLIGLSWAGSLREDRAWVKFPKYWFKRKSRMIYNVQKVNNCTRFSIHHHCTILFLKSRSLIPERADPKFNSKCFGHILMRCRQPPVCLWCAGGHHRWKYSEKKNLHSVPTRCNSDLNERNRRTRQAVDM